MLVTSKADVFKWNKSHSEVKRHNLSSIQQIMLVVLRGLLDKWITTLMFFPLFFSAQNCLNDFVKNEGRESERVKSNGPKQRRYQVLAAILFGFVLLSHK